jgi:hypothetical protein
MTPDRLCDSSPPPGLAMVYGKRRHAGDAIRTAEGRSGFFAFNRPGAYRLWRSTHA